MNIHFVEQVVFDFLGSLPVRVEVVEEQLSSDGGLLPLRQFDERLGWTKSFAAQIRDGRQGPTHAVVEMVRQRVFGILAGYEDQNDHDTLRSDGVFKLVAGRRPDDLDLASQPTLARLENSVTAGDLLRLAEWCLQKFIHSFDQAPSELTLDIDVFDDPTHGQQQLTFFHLPQRLTSPKPDCLTSHANGGKGGLRSHRNPCRNPVACPATYPPMPAAVNNPG